MEVSLHSAMLVVFIIALSQAALRGLDVSCGCFGGAVAGVAREPAAGESGA